MEMKQKTQKPIASHAVDSLANSYLSVRAQTERLTAPLSEEDCSAQSMTDASPAKWHLAHTSWFFETFVLTSFCSDYALFNDAFHCLFNSYYNGVGAQFERAKRGVLTRPGLAEILCYRHHVDNAMEQLFGSGDLSRPGFDLITLGISHEQQHQELILTDIKHLFSCNPQYPAYRERWPLTSVIPSSIDWVGINAGNVAIGHDATTFHFDNEGPSHKEFVHPFELANRPVTNREFMEFIADGGYERPELWLSNGWAAMQANAWRAPAYWRRESGEWRCFTLHGDSTLDPNAPVCHVSFYEAEAFARWANARLPTEYEWEIVGKQHAIKGNFLESGALHPLALARAAESQVPAQLFGDVWEWTRSDYAPYPGYVPPAGTVGEYNGKFMSGQYVLRGGSCVTPADHIRPTYRNFFPPDARWQFSGIRLARDAASLDTRDHSGSRLSRSHDRPSFYRLDLPNIEEQKATVVDGLRSSPSHLPAALFYDYLGSKLFEAITELPEYYQTRTEAGLFERFSRDMAAQIGEHLGDDYQLVDLGAGNCEKAAKLLPIFNPARYVAVDVSADFLEAQLVQLQHRLPNFPIVGVATDFARELELPAALHRNSALAFFPGSSIGNFAPVDRSVLLQQIGQLACNTALLVGVDLIKDTSELEAAYNDKLGLTRAFNLNILRHVNCLLESDFGLDDWEHVAFYNDRDSRIEMHLEAKRDVEVCLPNRPRRYAQGERILTEHSYKWSLRGLHDMLSTSGFRPIQVWADPAKRFAVALASAEN